MIDQAKGRHKAEQSGADGSILTDFITIVRLPWHRFQYRPCQSQPLVISPEFVMSWRVTWASKDIIILVISKYNRITILKLALYWNIFIAQLYWVVGGRLVITPLISVTAGPIFNIQTALDRPGRIVKGK